MRKWLCKMFGHRFSFGGFNLYVFFGFDNTIEVGYCKRCGQVAFVDGLPVNPGEVRTIQWRDR